MLFKALRARSPEYIDDEIDMIKNIGKELKYTDYELDNVLQAAKKTLYQKKKER